jgi:hypothetical protein
LSQLASKGKVPGLEAGTSLCFCRNEGGVARRRLIGEEWGATCWRRRTSPTVKNDSIFHFTPLAGAIRTPGQSQFGVVYICAEGGDGQAHPAGRSRLDEVELMRVGDPPTPLSRTLYPSNGLASVPCNRLHVAHPPVIVAGVPPRPLGRPTASLVLCHHVSLALVSSTMSLLASRACM